MGTQAVMRRIGMTLFTRFEHPRIEPGSPIRPHVAYRMLRPLTSDGRGGAAAPAI